MPHLPHRKGAAFTTCKDSCSATLTIGIGPSQAHTQSTPHTVHLPLTSLGALLSLCTVCGSGPSTDPSRSGNWIAATVVPPMLKIRLSPQVGESRRAAHHRHSHALSTHTVHLRSVHTTDSVRTAWGTGEHHY